MHRHRDSTARSTTRPRPIRRVGALLRLLVGGGVLLVLAGCATGPKASDGATPARSSGTPSASAPAGPATTPPPATSAPGASSGSGGSSATPRATTSAVRTCAPEAVDVVLRSTDSGAGSIDYTVVLTNRGTRACTISGAPTARLLSATETQLGAPATGSGTSGPVVRLEPGAAAATVVRVVHVGDDGGPLAGRCTPQRAVALAIDSTVYGRYDRLDGEFRGCAEADVAYMTVSPFRRATV